MPAFIDRTGQIFGRLTVLHRVAAKRVKWRCLCVCGQLTEVDAGKLQSGHTSSCGCYHRERRVEALITHGQSKRTRAYQSWVSMRRRCLNPTDAKYPIYGGRGITICEAWSDFAQFFADMGHPPEGYTIDRVDPNGNYEPTNCRWATPYQQAQNMRHTKRLTWNEQTHTISEWSAKFGVSRDTIKLRLKRGWTFEQVCEDLSGKLAIRRA
jgi:hypothetical protein